jgi:hypothetical protein
LSKFRTLTLWASLMGAMGACTVAGAAAVEQQVATETLADFEFDWARDGTYCPSCNFGSGNARISYVDLDYTVKVAPVDIATGRFMLESAIVIDSNAAFVTDYGNGPGWMFSQRGSELVYTRYRDGKPRRDANAGVAMARQVARQRWQAGFLPGGLKRVSPKGTTDLSDPVPRLSYGHVSEPSAYWRVAQGRAPENLLPGDDSVRGVGLRWVPGTAEILYSFVPSGEEDPQIFVYDTDTGTDTQITQGPGYKRAQFMMTPPEFGGDAVAFTVVDDTRFDLYRRSRDSQGQWQWRHFHTYEMPADQPFVSGSPEAFVHNGRTWIVLALRKTKGANAASNLGILALDPAQPELRMLTDDTQEAKWRSDPEYFIAADSVYIYYTRAVPLIFPTIGEGVWRVDTGLGPQTPR